MARRRDRSPRLRGRIAALGLAGAALGLAAVGLGLAVVGAAPARASEATWRAWLPLEPGTRLDYALHRDRTTERPGAPLARQFYHGRSRTEVLPERAEDAGRLRVRLFDVEREANLSGAWSRRRQEVTSYSIDRTGVRLHGFERVDDRHPYDPPLQFLRAPLRAGQSWEVGTLRDGALRVDARAEVVGVESLALDDRSFPDALHVRFEGPVRGKLGSDEDGLVVEEGHYRDDLWLARGVGPIRQVTAIDLRVRDAEGEPLHVSDLVTRTLAGAEPDDAAPAGRPGAP
jgi:hypothetical protein